MSRCCISKCGRHSFYRLLYARNKRKFLNKNVTIAEVCTRMFSTESVTARSMIVNFKIIIDFFYSKCCHFFFRKYCHWFAFCLSIKELSLLFVFVGNDLFSCEDVFCRKTIIVFSFFRWRRSIRNERSWTTPLLIYTSRYLR